MMNNRAWLYLGILALCWGTSFPAAKYTLQSLDPYTLVMHRVSWAALALWIVALIRGWDLPPRDMIGKYFLLAIVATALPFILITWGQTHIESGLASILNASTAIFGAIFAPMVFPEERITPLKAMGISLGFLGVITAIGWQALHEFSLREWAQWAVVCASISYTSATIATKKYFSHIKGRTNTLGMLTASSILMIVFVALFIRPEQVWPVGWTWFSMGWTALIATFLAYLIFYDAIKITGAANIQLVTLLVIPVAMIISAMLFHEKLSAQSYAGLFMIALGLLFIDERAPRMILKRWRKTLEN